MRARISSSRRRRGFALPIVLLFLMIAFAAAALMFRTSSTAIRVEQARVLRASRTEWTASAMASALRLLQTGNPPSEPYSCKLVVTEDEETRYFLATFEKTDPTHWTVQCAVATSGDLTPEPPLTFTVPPAAPTGLVATTASSSQINLAWDDVEFDKGYLVERSANGVDGWSQIATTAKNITAYASIGLTNNTTYYYRVLATNSAGEGEYSDVANATTEQIPPLAPDGVSAVAISTSQIDVSWNDVAGETGYKIQRSPDGINGWTQIATPGANVTTYSDTGLTATTAYYYRVCGNNAKGDGDFSDTVTATTLTPPPAQPTNFTATASSSSQIDLAWTDVTGETAYEIERSPDGTNNWTQITTPAADAVTFHDTGLTSSTTYYYRIRATNAGGASAYSDVANATTQTEPPAAPAGLSAVGASTSQITLSWTDVANETGYKIERSPDNSTWTQIDTAAADATSYPSTGLSPSTTYYYRIRATNAGGNSGYSDVASATTQTPPPSAPAGFSATAVSTSQIDLAWADVSGETGYLVERSPDNSTWTQIASVAANATSYSSTGLSESTTYYYRIRATNAGGNSSYSNVSSADTLTPAPSAPTGLNVSVASSSQINLTWTDNASNETGYKIERSPDGSTWSQIATAAANATSYGSSGLSAATTYYYRVRANNAGGDSAYSNTASATTLPTIPADPSGLSAVATSNSQINLAWTDNASNETGYQVERSPDGSTWSLITTTAANATSYSNTGLSNSTTYYYRVRATNAGGNSGYSSSANATTTNGVPPAPSGLSATTISNSQIDLAWTDNSTNETGFKIERSTTGVGSWSQIGTVAAGVTTYSSTSLTANKAYYYRVRAYNGTGNSSYTSTATATTLPNVPADPTGLSAAATSNSQINLAWTDNASNETAYKIERSPDGSAWSQIAIAAANATSYSDTGLSNSTTYYYRVRASNAGGDSGYSSAANATTTNGTPPAPSGLVAGALSSSQIALVWNDNATNETGVKIERSPDNATWTQIATVASGTSSYTDNGLSVTTTYYYRVRAYNGTGNSAYSNTDSDATTSTPADPSNLTATVASTTSIKLDWTDNSNNETGFRIQRSLNGSTSWTTVTTTAAGVTTYTNTGLTTGQIYYYRVRAQGSSVSGWSNIANATP